MELKKRMRAYKVILVDESQKTMLLDDSLKVDELITQIAKAINLKNPDEFGLKVDHKKGTCLDGGGICRMLYGNRFSLIFACAYTRVYVSSVYRMAQQCSFAF